jgi:hypothetical protein
LTGQNLAGALLVHQVLEGVVCHVVEDDHGRHRQCGQSRPPGCAGPPPRDDHEDGEQPEADSDHAEIAAFTAAGVWWARRVTAV